MSRLLAAVIVCTLAFLLTGPAFAATCTLCDGGDEEWGPVGTITNGTCEGAETPSGDDLFVCPADCTVNIVDDLIPTADTFGIEMEPGCSIYVDAMDALGAAGAGAVDIQLMAGGVGEPAGEANVGIYAWPGSTFITTPAYLQVGVSSSPELVNTHTATNSTTFTWGETYPCRDYGGTLDCSSEDTGEEAQYMCSVWPDARYQPAQGGGVGDYWLDEAIDAVVEDRWQACFKANSGSYLHCYSVIDADTPAGYSMLCVDVRQPDHLRAYTEDPQDMPMEARDMIEITLGAAIAKGDTCADLASGSWPIGAECAGANDPWSCCDSSGVGTDCPGASAYAGRWFRLQASPAVETARRITRVFDDVQCDGTSGGDSLWVAPETPFAQDWASSTDATIDVTGINTGDEFVIRAGLNITAATGEAENAAKVVLSSTTLDLDGVTFAGAGEVRFLNAAGTLGCIHAIDVGDYVISVVDRLASFRFEGTDNLTVDCATVLGGDVTDGGVNAIELDMTTGTNFLQRIATRYTSGTDVHGYTNGVSTSRLVTGISKHEFASILADSKVIAGLNSPSDTFTAFSSIYVSDLFCANCLRGTMELGSMFQTGTGTPASVFRAERVSVVGLTGGAIGNTFTTTNLVIDGLLWRGGDLNTPTTSKSVLPAIVHHADVRQVNGASSPPQIAALQTNTLELTDSIFALNETTRDALIVVGYIGGDITVRNNIFWDNQTTHASGGAVVSVPYTPNPASSTLTIDHNTFGYSAGVTHEWRAALEVIGYAWGADETLSIGNLLFDNFVNSTATSGDVYSFDMDDDLMDLATATELGPICVIDGDATGGGTVSYTDINNVDDFTASLIVRGWADPIYQNVEGGDYQLALGSAVQKLGCGARSRQAAPGFPRGPVASFTNTAMGIRSEQVAMPSRGRTY